MEHKIKIAVVYGTRPEILKLIPIILHMQQQGKIELVLINAGQHENMVEEIEKQFNIVPQFRLQTREPNQSFTPLQIKRSHSGDPIL